MWDTSQYMRFGDERSRPFFDLLARVGADDPRYVVDLGCGPGNLTVTLERRWPAAEVCGVDSSPEMIEAARDLGAVAFSMADVREWAPERAPDVIVSNAVLQWVPGHHELLVRWAGLLAPGGWLAFQVPGNFDQPSHAILREMAASRRWRSPLRDVELNRQTASAQEYAELLSGPGRRVDAWETTYVHVLHGENPVLEWYKGTGLRPVLAALGAGDAAEFLAEYGDRTREAYPASAAGTFFPFHRVFAVVHRQG